MRSLNLPFNKKFMKKKFFFSVVIAAALISCNDNNTSTTTTDTTSTSNKVDTLPAAPPPQATAAPLDTVDQEFIRKAAQGGKMEVQLGNIAQQNAMNERVKGFGSMMVNDHSQANNELTQFAQSRNVMLTDSMDKKTQDHINSMEKMKGKAFDRSYMNMMVNDHNKDIAEFEKAASSAHDADLKAWAAKTLPVLKKHLDSAKAISKSKL
jgi:putative membrane protein